MKIWQVIIFGLVVHIILLYSIFDIYFTSPLVHGMTPHAPRSPPPAKRLVLFSADGLRADKIFEPDPQGKIHAPYLRNIMYTNGAWGVSHTRVPTESRPGHVALIAGFYEDVSAVAKGWKENPVLFDSVFNETRYTWSWGSPDILPMFAKGASGDHVFTYSYSSAHEDFAASDSSKLDTWVFEKVKSFFKNATIDVSLKRMIHQDRIVIFMHLLGIDTNGHAHKPYSDIYLENINTVDSGVKDMVALFNDYYRDNKTAFVLSSDHGMTNWGSHGAGHPSETLTPIIAWGAGIRSAIPSTTCGDFKDTFCKDWKLQNLSRVDIEQADVAPLMSYLVGIPYPMNSVGILPVEFLSSTDWEKAEGLYANAEQMLAQFQVKMFQVKDRTIPFVFRPFRELTQAQQLFHLRNIRKLMQTGNNKQAIIESQELIHTTLRGLKYYQTYDRLFLGFSIVCSFLGWMCCVLLLLLQEHSGIVSARDKTLTADSSWLRKHVYKIFFGIGLCVTGILFIQSSPWTYYMYSLTPVLLWMKVFEGSNLMIKCVQTATEKKMWPSIIISVVLSIIGLEILVLGFYFRELLSVNLMFIAAWAFTSGVIKKSKLTVLGWVLSCVFLAVFPLLPVVGHNKNYNLVLTAGPLIIIIGVSMVKILGLWTPKEGTHPLAKWTSRTVLCLQLLLILTAAIVVKSTSASLANFKGLPKFNKILSWTLLVICPILPVLSSMNLMERLLSLALGLAAPYILLSITYESLFLICLISLLYFWLKMEEQVIRDSLSPKMLNQFDFNKNGPKRPTQGFGVGGARLLEVADLRRAFFCVILTQVAFFGTGNIASINSFDPASVLCFLTVFSPFVMGALLILKIMIPFLLVTCALRGVHVVTEVPVSAIILIAFMMSDFIGLHFFFLVRDFGSWQEIGTSISHYVISMTMVMGMMLMMGLSHLLTCFQPGIRGCNDYKLLEPRS